MNNGKRPSFTLAPVSRDLPGWVWSWEQPAPSSVLGEDEEEEEEPLVYSVIKSSPPLRSHLYREEEEERMMRQLWVPGKSTESCCQIYTIERDKSN